MKNESFRKIILFFSFVSIVLFACTYAQAYTQASASPYEVTASDYADFLNHVTSSDVIPGEAGIQDNINPDHLFDQKMETDSKAACIIRVGTPGNFHYEVIAGRENCPISFVDSFSKKRYCEWRDASLENDDSDLQSDCYLASNESIFFVTTSDEEERLSMATSEGSPFSLTEQLFGTAALLACGTCLLGSDMFALGRDNQTGGSFSEDSLGLGRINPLEGIDIESPTISRTLSADPLPTGSDSKRSSKKLPVDFQETTVVLSEVPLSHREHRLTPAGLETKDPDGEWKPLDRSIWLRTWRDVAGNPFNSVLPVFITGYNRTEAMIEKKKASAQELHKLLEIQAAYNQDQAKPERSREGLSAPDNDRVEMLKAHIAVLEKARIYQNNMVRHLEQSLKVAASDSCTIRSGLKINEKPNKVELIVNELEEDYELLTADKDRLAGVATRLAIQRENEPLFLDVFRDMQEAQFDDDSDEEEEVERLNRASHCLNQAITHRHDLINLRVIYAESLQPPFIELSPEAQSTVKQNKLNCFIEQLEAKAISFYAQSVISPMRSVQSLCFESAYHSLCRAHTEAKNPEPRQEVIQLYLEKGDLYKQAAEAPEGSIKQECLREAAEFEMKSLDNVSFESYQEVTKLYKQASEAPEGSIKQYYLKKAADYLQNVLTESYHYLKRKKINLYQQVVEMYKKAAEDPEGSTQQNYRIAAANYLINAESEAKSHYYLYCSVDFYPKAADLCKQAAAFVEKYTQQKNFQTVEEGSDWDDEYFKQVIGIHNDAIHAWLAVNQRYYKKIAELLSEAAFEVKEPLPRQKVIDLCQKAADMWKQTSEAPEESSRHGILAKAAEVLSAAAFEAKSLLPCQQFIDLCQQEADIWKQISALSEESIQKKQHLKKAAELLSDAAFEAKKPLPHQEIIKLRQQEADMWKQISALSEESIEQKHLKKEAELLSDVAFIVKEPLPHQEVIELRQQIKDTWKEASEAQEEPSRQRVLKQRSEALSVVLFEAKKLLPRQEVIKLWQQIADMWKQISALSEKYFQQNNLEVKQLSFFKQAFNLQKDAESFSIEALVPREGSIRQDCLTKAAELLSNAAFEANKESPCQQFIDLCKQAADMWQQVAIASDKKYYLKKAAAALDNAVLEAKKRSPYQQAIHVYQQEADMYKQAAEAPERSLKKYWLSQAVEIFSYNVSRAYYDDKKPKQQVIQLYKQEADMHKQAAEAPERSIVQYYLREAALEFSFIVSEANKSNPNKQAIQLIQEKIDMYKKVAAAPEEFIQVDYFQLAAEALGKAFSEVRWRNHNTEVFQLYKQEADMYKQAAQTPEGSIQEGYLKRAAQAFSYAARSESNQEVFELYKEVGDMYKHAAQAPVGPIQQSYSAAGDTFLIAGMQMETPYLNHEKVSELYKQAGDMYKHAAQAPLGPIQQSYSAAGEAFISVAREMAETRFDNNEHLDKHILYAQELKNDAIMIEEISSCVIM